MAKAGYVGNQPVRESQAESYPGAWTGQEQYQETRVDNWPKSIYEVERSVRINSADNAYFSRTPSTTGNTRTWTWSGWIKRSALSAGNKTVFMATTDNYVNNYTRFIFANNNIYINHSSGLGGTRQSVAVYRDTAAWMHVVIALDTTQATAASRLRFYVNGQEITAYSGANPGLNAEWWVNSSSATHFIGTAAGQEGFDGYLANIHLIDGLALTPSAFGVTDPETNEWMPKKYANSYGYGTNGFWLKFADNSAATATALGKDSSPNGNNWTPNNLSVTAGAGNDSLVDTPTSYGTDAGVGGEVRGNYCTWNPLRSLASLLNGNLDHSNITTNFEGSTGTIYVTTGKWYWEWLITSAVSDTMIGVATNDHPLNSNYSASTTSWTYFSANGQKYGNGANGAAYGAAWSNGDLIGIALDMDAGSITFYKNGTSQGVAFSTGIQGKSVTPLISGFNTTGTKGSANFGQRPFAYTAPSGFKALCDTNLPSPQVAKPSTVFDTKLYTGNGSTQTISELEFSPDFIWIKSRSAATDHALYDRVRVDSRRLESNNTDAEVLDSTLVGFGSNSFLVNATTQINANAATYVAWAWDAGSSSATNTQGSITSTVRTNGYLSIVAYTGNSTVNATVGHGLGVTPGMVIYKSRTNTQPWVVWHRSFATGNTYMILNGTSASATDWNAPSAPSSTVLYPGSPISTNSDSMVAYCFAPVSGYSSFGSYTGNGSTDGPFVFTGMRPRYLLVKRTDAISSWEIYDAARNQSNLVTQLLEANTSGTEFTGTTNYVVDFLSNGFKIRGNFADLNASNGTFVYAAFSEAPFQYARAR